MQKDNEQMLTLTQELLSCRAPSPSYPVFPFEQMALFKIIVLKEGRSWQIVTPSQFIETFTRSDFFWEKSTMWIIFAWDDLFDGLLVQSSSPYWGYSCESIYHFCH